MIIAGEASGDLHGSAVVEQLKKKYPDLDIVGIGGDRMQNAGMELLFHIKDMAFLGFTEVIKHIPFIKRVQKKLLDVIKSRNIGEVVLIDYPGFNLNFARKAKKTGVKLTYYISPQLWAWGSHRADKIKKLIDKMLVVFPFEEKFYKDRGIDVEYVGHPLLERIEKFEFLSEEEIKKEIGLNLADDYLLLLPGSRKHEIELIFPEIINAAEEISKNYNLKIVVACSDNIDDSLFSQFESKANFIVVKGNTYNLMKYAKFGIVKSGTSTLESALIGMPFILVYKTSLLTYLIGKSLIKIDSIAMPNIVAGKKIVDELIQSDTNSKNIVNKIRKYLENKDHYENLIDNLKIVKEKLSAGKYSASERAAEVIGSLIYEVK